MMNLVYGNASQALFTDNEKAYNSNPNEMKSQDSVFIEQVRMSTYYQDNPWQTLTYSQKFDHIPILGGDINPNQGPGYRPGNTYENYLRTKTQSPTSKPTSAPITSAPSTQAPVQQLKQHKKDDCVIC
jgi:hypothetical protein